MSEQNKLPPSDDLDATGAIFGFIVGCIMFTIAIFIGFGSTGFTWWVYAIMIVGAVLAATGSSSAASRGS